MAEPAYDDSNIFAKILRGEIPSHKVYEDDVALAIMDVMPQADGHVLVLPKTPARNILDVDPGVLAALAPRLQKLARAVKTRPRRRRPDHPAVQRGRRRPDGLPPAFPYCAALDRRAAATA